MKLLIDGEYKEVGFWSFLKCMLLTYGTGLVIFWATIFIILFTIGVIFG